MYQPVLFIGIGEKNHYFTLRESYMHEWTSGSPPRVNKEVRSFHHFNLSQDPDDAIAKATEAAGRMGLPLHTTRAEITEKLAEIKRRSAEEMAEAEARETHWKAEREREQAQRMEDWRGQIDAGYFPECFRGCEGSWVDFFALPFAPFSTWRKRDDLLAELMAEGHAINPEWDDKRAKTYAWNCIDNGDHGHSRRLYAIASADIGYLNWLMDKGERGEFEADSLIALAAAKALEICADQRLPRPDPVKHTGEVGKRQVFEVTVVRVFVFEGYYGTTNFVTMVDADGACLLSKGVFKPELGERLKIKATVKGHDEYKGQAQTVVQRVKVEETSHV